MYPKTIDLKKAWGSLQDEPLEKEIRNFAGMEVKEWKPYVPEDKHKKSSQLVFDGEDFKLISITSIFATS